MKLPIPFATPCATFALLAALLGAPALAAPTVSINGPTGATPGGVLQLSVAAAGFTDLYAYQFDVNFNPAVFSAAAVAEGAFLPGGGSTFFDGGSADNVAGVVTFILGSLVGPGAGVSGSGDLVKLVFNVSTAFTQTSALTISNFTALDSALNPIDVTLRGLSVTAVPEPTSLALALLALGAGLGCTRPQRRGRAVAAAAV